MDTADDSSYRNSLGDQITLLAGQINAANYQFLKLIAEFDRLKAWAQYGCRSCAHWLNWKCGISYGAGREKVRVAKAMEGLDDINQAFSAGELSYSKVRAMTRVATEKNQEYLLMISQYGTAQHVEQLVKAYRTVNSYDDYMPNGRLSDQRSGDGGDLAIEKLQDSFDAQLTEQKHQDDKRSFSSYQDDDGMWVIKARLPAEEGGLLVKLISALGEQIANNQLGESEDINEQSEDMHEESIPAETKITFPQRRADALLAISEHFLAADDCDVSFKGFERCQLMLHVHAGAGSDMASDFNSAHLDDCWLPSEAAKRLSCDASMVLIEEDEVGNVLDIGRRSRIIPAGMSRALAIRDHGHCQFPGCCESHFTEGHHIVHWAEGGETKLDNLVTLCRFHHQQLHRGVFNLSLGPAKPGQHFSERLAFTCSGKVLETHPCCHIDAHKPLPWPFCNDVAISTAVTHWQGERMDLGLAVEGLIMKSH